MDSSACIAVLLGEPDHEELAALLANASELWMSSFSVLETSIVIGTKKGPQGLLAWDALQQRLAFQVVPFTSVHAEVAREAWQRFGKGRHAASLNIGDCCSYATAQHAALPLLFKGEDFAQTDVESVKRGQ